MVRTLEPPSRSNETRQKRRQPLRPVTWPGAFVPHILRQETTADIESILKMNILCSKCRPIREWLRSCDYSEVKGKKSKVFEHHDNGLELEKRYLRGCHLCTLIWQSMIEPWHTLYEHERLRKRKTRLTQVQKPKTLKSQCGNQPNSHPPIVLFPSSYPQG